MIRAEFLEVKVQVFPDYSHYLSDKYYDISNAFMKMNIRTDLYGLYNGVIIVNDSDDIIKNNGDIIIRVSVTDQKTTKPSIFMFGTSHNDLTILQNGDVVRSYNLVPYHDRKPFRFSRKLTNNSIESMEMMIDEMYSDCDLIKSKIVEGSTDAYLPSVIWVKYFKDYMRFINKKGLNTENDNFVFCWYEGGNIRVMDYEKLIGQTPIKGLIMEENLVGTLGSMIQDVPVFKYEYMTESNNYERQGSMETTYITTSNEKNGSHIEVFGAGSEFFNIDRSCIYREMTYENGYEEINQSIIMNQYDAYAKFRSYGDMRIKPGVCINVEDAKKAIKELNIIDDVLYEFTPTTSFTHAFMMTTNKPHEVIEVNRVVSMDSGNYPYAYGDSQSNNYMESADAQGGKNE